MSEQAPIGRLAWLACQKDLERSSRRWWDQVGRIFTAGGGIRSQSELVVDPVLGARMTNTTRSRRLGWAQFAVEEVTPRLSAEEKSALRERGVLPEWFVPAVLERAEQIKQEMRRR